jgi:signal transduction histidine kinase
MVLNLANNAVGYAPGGVHTWRTRTEGRQVALSLEDQGPGVRPDEIDRIFDRFYRGAAGGRSSPGSGLGLPIVKSIAEAHGGHAEAANGRGGGAVFTVTLPRYSAASGA